MYHTILVPLDGSKRAEEILPHVETFANCFSARVILLQVIETIQAIDLEYPPNYVEETWISEVIQQAQAYFENLPWEYKVQQEVKILIEQGPIVQTIIRVAEREGADLHLLEPARPEVVLVDEGLRREVEGEETRLATPVAGEVERPEPGLAVDAE